MIALLALWAALGITHLLTPASFDGATLWWLAVSLILCYRLGGRATPTEKETHHE